MRTAIVTLFLVLIAINLNTGCDAGNNGIPSYDQTDVVVQEQISYCNDDNDCLRGYRCAEMQDQADKVCVLEENTPAGTVSGVQMCGDYMLCEAGSQCMMLQSGMVSVCVKLPEPVVETSCPFEVVGDGKFFVSDNGITTVTVAQYFPETCELLMYQEGNLAGINWYYHFYIDENGEKAVYGKWATENNAQVKLLYLSYVRITIRESYNELDYGGWYKEYTFTRILGLY